MKRPEGFDPRQRRAAAPVGAKPRVPNQAEDQGEDQARPVTSARVPRLTKPAKDAKLPRKAAAPRAEEAAQPSRRERNAPAREARRNLRAATRERRRYERREVRRFTVRSRARRRALIALGSTVVVLAIMFAVAVFSPILAVRHIRIEGTDRLSASTLQSSLSGQLGTPLALVDFGRITKELGKEPLIASYTTETVPPDTLIISITERQPIGVLKDGSVWDQVDPAGVVVESSAKRPSKLPIITAKGGVQSVAFTTAATVLRTIPSSMRAKVHSISASTADDAEFVLADGTRVLWGSDERPALKAQVLTKLMKVDKPAGTVRYDVSSVPTTASYSYP